jgi:hypothetical protein
MASQPIFAVQHQRQKGAKPVAKKTLQPIRSFRSCGSPRGGLRGPPSPVGARLRSIFKSARSWPMYGTWGCPCSRPMKSLERTSTAFHTCRSATYRTNRSRCGEVSSNLLTMKVDAWLNGNAMPPTTAGPSADRKHEACIEQRVRRTTGQTKEPRYFSFVSWVASDRCRRQEGQLRRGAHGIRRLRRETGLRAS